jgi:hypothetical protein
MAEGNDLHRAPVRVRILTSSIVYTFSYSPGSDVRILDRTDLAEGVKTLEIPHETIAPHLCYAGRVSIGVSASSYRQVDIESKPASCPAKVASCQPHCLNLIPCY